jgi:hypothetical protein
VDAVDRADFGVQADAAIDAVILVDDLDALRVVHTDGFDRAIGNTGFTGDTDIRVNSH